MRERISSALKSSMHEDDSCRTSTLRLISAALKDREAAAQDEEGLAPPDDEAIALDVLHTMVKQREESIRGYEEAGRLELADRERRELAVISEFLPQPMSQDELDAAVAEAVAETEASGLRDMGRVVDLLKARHPGRLDFARVGRQIKAALG